MDLYKEVEKYAHYFNTYIIANNLSKHDIDNTIINIIYNELSDEHLLFFLKILKYSNVFRDYNTIQLLISIFYEDFLYYESINNKNLHYRYVQFPTDIFFNLSSERFYTYLTVSILRRYYTPYISYSQWKNLYNSHSINT